MIVYGQIVIEEMARFLGGKMLKNEMFCNIKCNSLSHKCLWFRDAIKIFKAVPNYNLSCILLQKKGANYRGWDKTLLGTKVQ